MTDWSKTLYDQETKFTTPLPDAKFLASFSKEINVLDVGCGYGRILKYLQDLGFKNLTGFDISTSYVDEARRNCPRAKVFASSFENFDDKNKYDLILLMGVIEYILSDDEQENFFKKIQ